MLKSSVFSSGEDSAGEEREAQHMYLPACEVCKELNDSSRLKDSIVSMIPAPSVMILPLGSKTCKTGEFISPLTFLDAMHLTLYNSPSKVICELLTERENADWGTACGEIRAHEQELNHHIIL